jgi:hypothetical protein
MQSSMIEFVNSAAGRDVIDRVGRRLNDDIVVKEKRLPNPLDVVRRVTVEVARTEPPLTTEQIVILSVFMSHTVSSANEAAVKQLMDNPF